MADTAEAPRRAARLTLLLDADSLHELAAGLRSIANMVEREELTTGVSGGPYSGWIYELLHDPAITHEAYFAKVREYLAGLNQGAAHG